jgi:kinesin family protein 20
LWLLLNLAQVMIVNVNPYDTGFDENSHVMRFSAVAREVQTTAANKVTFPGLGLKRQISSQFSALKQAVSGPMKIKVVVPVLPKVIEGEASAAAATPGRPAGAPVRLVVGGRETDGFVMVEEELEVVEEDEGESEDERDVLVDSLFEQLKELKTRVGRRGDFAFRPVPR